MEDRELLELAAKGAGIEFSWRENTTPIGAAGMYWNPLEDDGDALRLAVMLNIEIHLDLSVGTVFTAFGICGRGYNTFEEVSENNGCAFRATRRAIVRAAAEIGKTKA